MSNRLRWRRRPTRWAWLVATCGGLGYLNPGPGTWTSLAAAAIWWALAAELGRHASATLAMTILLIALATMIGIPSSTIVERESDRHDPGFITIDEAAGQWLTLLPVPLSFWFALKVLGYDVQYRVSHAVGAAIYAVVCVALFRLFDIWKPWPIRHFERLRGGLGIMADDLAAGFYAVLVQVLFVGAMFALHAAK